MGRAVPDWEDGRLFFALVFFDRRQISAQTGRVPSVPTICCYRGLVGFWAIRHPRGSVSSVCPVGALGSQDLPKTFNQELITSLPLPISALPSR
jgi:hypothetical protein